MTFILEKPIDFFTALVNISIFLIRSKDSITSTSLKASLNSLNTFLLNKDLKSTDYYEHLMSKAQLTGTHLKFFCLNLIFL